MTPHPIIETFLKGWSNDLPRLLTVFTDDVVYVDKPLGADLSGKAELEAFANAFFVAFPDIEFALASPPVDAGDHISFEWRVTGTHQGALNGIAATQRAVDFAGISTVELADGKISRCTDYWDLATLLRQIGQLPV